MSNVNRNPLGSPGRNTELHRVAVENNAVWFHLQLYRGGPDSESFASIYALCPFRPNVGEQVIAEDGTLCTVTRVTFRIQKRDFGYELSPLILAVANESQE